MFEGFKGLDTKVKFVSFIENVEDPDENYVMTCLNIFDEEEYSMIEFLGEICVLIRNTMFTVMYLEDGEVKELEVKDSDDVFENLITTLTSSYKLFKGKRFYIIDSSDMFYDEGPFVFLTEEESDLDSFIPYIFNKLGWEDTEMKRLIVKDAGSESTFKGIDISHLRLFEYYEKELNETARFQMRVVGYYEEV